MLKTKTTFRWALLGILGLTIALFGPGVYRGMSDNREDTYQGLKVLSDVIEMVEKNYVDEVESKEVIVNAIKGMVSSLDPHSSFLTPEEYEELKIDTQGEFTGIGIHVTMRNNLVTVISPIEGTPAYKAGIKANDRIIKVDGMTTDNLRDAVKRMRGPKGTDVMVTIIREGEPKPIDFDLIRDVIPINSIKSVTLTPGYGYVWVTHFRDNTYEDLVKALDKLENQKTPLKGLVLDLRDNPGGVLRQALSISDLFLEEGAIMSSKGRLKRHNQTHWARKNDSHPRRYPMVVLINGGSASASEIVAGALQDQKRALIIGTTSFGKGSVQTVEELRDGYALKLTIARYYTPSGRSIQAKGVEPDIVVQHKILNDTPKDQNRLFKEKDLSNHLNAEPDKKKKKGSLKKEKSESSKKRDRKPLRLSPLDPEQLVTDSQIQRALDVLMGYDIFHKMSNG